MRVLMFGWEFPPHIAGGLGTACYGLTRGLAKNGAEIIFVVPKAYGDEDQRFVRIVNASDIEMPADNDTAAEIWDRVSFVQINSNMVPYSTPEEFRYACEMAGRESSAASQDIWNRRYEFSGSYGKDLYSEVWRYGMIAMRVARELDGQFDVIHAHDWLTYHAGVAARRVSGKPLAVHIHATEFDRSGENINEVIYGIERSGMEQADVVIAVSDLTRNTVIRRYGIPAEKVVTVHNAVRFAEQENSCGKRTLKEKTVTFLGRVTYQKGPEYFVEAAAKVLSKRRDIRFVMAGSGDMLNRMVRRVAQLGISDRFHFTGFLKGAEVNRMFSRSDVYVMPSVSEPFGISPLEAMRVRVPVIISRQSGVAEILKHAVKVDYWDVDGLADAIHGLASYDVLSQMLGRKGCEEVTGLKWSNAAAKVLGIYEGIANR